MVIPPTGFQVGPILMWMATMRTVALLTLSALALIWEAAGIVSFDSFLSFVQSILSPYWLHCSELLCLV